MMQKFSCWICLVSLRAPQRAAVSAGSREKTIGGLRRSPCCGCTRRHLLLAGLQSSHPLAIAPLCSLTGRGRQVIAVCKSADLLLMVLDAGKPHYHREILTRELEAVSR